MSSNCPVSPIIAVCTIHLSQRWTLILLFKDCLQQCICKHEVLKSAKTKWKNQDFYSAEHAGI